MEESRSERLSERITVAVSFLVLAVVLVVWGCFKLEECREEAQKEQWEAEDAIALKELSVKRKQERAEKEKEAELKSAELEMEPIPDSLSGSWTWTPTSQSRVFISLNKAEDGFILEQSFVDGSNAITAVTAKRVGANIELKPKQKSSIGDFWIIDENASLLVMDSEGTIGEAKPKSAPLELKGIMIGMTELEVVRATGQIEEFTIAGVKAKYPPTFKYGIDGGLDEFWFVFDDSFGTVLEALASKYPTLKSENRDTFSVSGDEALIQLTKSGRKAHLSFLSHRAIIGREKENAEQATSRKKDI
jgi:hypothetical protein